MSYILDALRRADSERERGSVPGLHTQSVSMPQADDSTPRGARPWAWLVAGSLPLLLGALAWFLLGRQTLPADRTPLASASAVPAPVALPTESATPLSPAASSSALAVPLPKPVPSVRKPALRPAPGVVNAKSPKASAKVQAAASAAASAASAPALAKDARIYTLNELPDEVRKDLPALQIGGAMYSQTAANRMLIVNGQLFHEGDTLAPGLTLEQIKLRSAVLRLKGYRYGISF